jgi:ABC-type antimicrobial peptide transport system permease subunit
LAAIEPAAAVEQAGTGLAIAGPDKVFLQVTSAITGLLGTFALVLALVGLYGALSQVVARRRREIGLRIALGASRSDVVRMVLRDGLRPVISGIVLGLVLGAIVRFALQPLFYRLLPSLDPLVLTAVPLLLLAAGAAACLIPARRASQVDPNQALKDL